MSMTPITVLIVPGTNEHRSKPDLLTQGMCARVLERLPQDRFVGRVVSYPADYGLEINYALSVAAGEAALEQAIRTTPGPKVLVGYSQGAAVVGNVAARLRSVDGGGEILAVGLISDPARHRAQHRPLPIPVEGYGCTGERLIDERQVTVYGTYTKVYQLAAQGDPICSLPAGNPLRSIADLTDRMALNDFGGWWKDIIADFRHRRMQRWWSLRNWRTWGGAIAFSRGMVSDRRHFIYAEEVPPGCNDTFVGLLAEELVALGAIERDPQLTRQYS